MTAAASTGRCPFPNHPIGKPDGVCGRSLAQIQGPEVQGPAPAREGIGLTLDDRRGWVCPAGHVFVEGKVALT